MFCIHSIVVLYLHFFKLLIVQKFNFSAKIGNLNRAVGRYLFIFTACGKNHIFKKVFKNVIIRLWISCSEYLLNYKKNRFAEDRNDRQINKTASRESALGWEIDQERK